MKALVKRKSEVGLWLEDVPVPSIEPHEVMVKVDRTGICGTDVHIYQWDAWAQATIPVPMVVGHEFVGKIVEVGSAVQGYQEGDIVSAEGHVVCEQCRNCRAGFRHLCPNAKGIGVHRTGVFANYAAIPATNLWKHGPEMDLDVASIFDPLGNATHTALSFPLIGEDVLITGAGPIGAMSAAVARQAGARNVVITDVNPWRLELAKKMGATRTVDVTKEDLKDIQKEIGMAEGFDVGLEMSGNGSAFRSMIDNMINGGKIAMLGIPATEIAIDWNQVVFKMLTIKGIYGREMYDTWHKMMTMLQSGLDISTVITHRMHYSDFQAGFDAMLSGQSGKVILNWND